MTRDDEQRLEDIRAAIAAIHEHLKRGKLSDGLVFDAVRVRLIEIGEAVKALPSQLLTSESAIPWEQVAGMRDRLAHRYFDTSHAIVAGTVANQRPVDNATHAPSQDGYVPAMSSNHANDDIYIDANGCPTERIRVGDQEIVVHYDDIPESDITTVDGLRVTTPIRTVIDIAAETPPQELERIIRDCLERGLFTVEEAWARLDQPDMATRMGAQMVRAALPTQAPGA